MENPSAQKMQLKKKKKHGLKQLIYTHNLSTADFFSKLVFILFNKLNIASANRVKEHRAQLLAS